MKKILLSIFAGLIALNALCQDWIYVSTTKQKKDKYYIKSTYESKENYGFHTDLIKIWVKSIVAQQTFKKKIYKNIECRSLWSIDCKKNQYRIETLIVHSSAGKILESYRYFAEDFDIVRPDTIGEKLVAKVCSLFN